MLLLTAVQPSLAEGIAGDLDAAIEQHRKGLLVIEAPPGTAVVVEPQRHEFWFGAALACQAFDGQMRPEDRQQYLTVFRTNPGGRPREIDASEQGRRQAGSLAFQLSRATNDLHHTLLRKRDGTFCLALFQEAASYDAKTRRDLEVPISTVTLKLPWTSPGIRLFRLNASADPAGRFAEQTRHLTQPSAAYRKTLSPGSVC
jgi:hypothetical protein